MKKAMPKSVNLGTKRSCTTCATKFYDFGKEQIICPKCQSSLDPELLSPVVRLPEPKKAAKPAIKEIEEVGTDDSEMIESVDDLGDSEEEDLTESLDLVEEEEEEEQEY